MNKDDEALPYIWVEWPNGTRAKMSSIEIVPIEEYDKLISDRKRLEKAVEAFKLLEDAEFHFRTNEFEKASSFQDGLALLREVLLGEVIGE